MKTNKSFSEFILDVWAAIMRTVFPRYCVKCLTLKTRKHAAKFLPGGKKEYAILNGVNFDEQFIKNRRWSQSTRVRLLADRDKAAASDAFTEEELMAAYKTGDLGLFIAVMRVYTPSRERMLQFLREKEASFMAAVARQVPTAFNALKPWEIFGIDENDAPSLNLHGWEIARALTSVNTSWAPLFMKGLLKVSAVKDELATLFRFFFLNALKGDEDISEHVLEIHRVFPELCASLRFSVNRKYKHLGKCFCVLFPKIRNEVSSLYVTGKDEFCSANQEAALWLACGLDLCHLGRNEDVLTCIISFSKALSYNLSEGDMDVLIERLCANSRRHSELMKLYSLAKSVRIKAIIEKQLATLYSCSSACFPYKGWQNESAILAALDTLAKHGSLPVSRLHELTPEQ